MRRWSVVLAALVLPALVGVGLGDVAATAAPSTRSACSDAREGFARCFAQVRTDLARSAQPHAAAYGPADIKKAYNLPGGTAGKDQVVAIVDAYDNPRAEADLAVYRSRYGLPPCTTANGCFRKVNQNGAAAPLPRADTGWGLEIALDLDAVSAACPLCKIVLVEANDNSFNNIGKAVDTASSLAHIVSNSYGAKEFKGAAAYAGHYSHPSTVYTVSSGDNGYGVEFPAALGTVTAVGGTTLKRSGGGRGFTETAWKGAGSGCSKYVAKPSWQHDTACAKRTVADVSAVADPATGLAVYDTFGYTGWLVVGGTSLSAPLIAGVYALAGNAAAVTYGSFPYGHTAGLYDVVSGANGKCGGSYLCTATAGFDGPTGLGTPNGVSAF